MTFFAPFVLYLTCLLCASDAGIAPIGVCALLCGLLSFWIPFLPVRVPIILRGIAAVSILLRLVLLWGDGSAKSAVFFALTVIVIALIAFDRANTAKSGLLATGAVPFSLLAVLLILFCAAGTFLPPAAVVPWEREHFLSAMVFPLSVTLLLPSVRGKPYMPLAALGAACAAVLPAVLFAFPLWENLLCVLLLPFCAACELRILCGKAA